MKRFSVLGDSISTFEGCNPEGFDVFYENERRDATGVRLVEDTWWAQVIEQCGGELLSNGSFSGSMVEGAGFPAANSAERIAALAKDGVAPDEILVFIGINDYGWGGPAAQAAGRGNALPATLDLSAIPEAEAGLASADAAERFGQAYSAMLARMRAAYPQAKVWCCTLCPGRMEGSVHSTFAYRLRGVHFDRYNDAIRLAAESNGCCVADVRALGRDYEALEGTHPTKRGMAQFALMVLHAMAARSKAALRAFLSMTRSAALLARSRRAGSPLASVAHTPELRETSGFACAEGTTKRAANRAARRTRPARGAPHNKKVKGYSFMQGKPLVLLLLVLYGAAFLAGFNENLVNMALVSIMADYGVDSVTAQWLVTGYMIVATVVVMCMAFLYRRFHLRTLFFAASALSFAGSAMGLVANGFEMLFAARLVQAVGTGIFIPLMMNTIVTVTPKNKLGTYLSIGGCTITFGPALAPVVCGALVTTFGWHSIFVVPMVAMAILFGLGLRFVKNLETSEAHLDVLSVVLAAVLLTALSLGLVQLTIDVPLALGSLAASALLSVAFVVLQLRCSHPLIDLEPLRNRAFWPALLLATVSMISMFSMSVLLPLYFEGAAGMTALSAGLVILVPVLANAGTTLLGGRIMGKRGEWPLLPLGFGAIALGFIALALAGPTLSIPVVFAAALLMYVAVGFVFSPSQTAGLRTLPPQQNPFGVALMTTVVQIAACVGPSLYIGIMSTGQIAAVAQGASAS